MIIERYCEKALLFCWGYFRPFLSHRVMYWFWSLALSPAPVSHGYRNVLEIVQRSLMTSHEFDYKLILFGKEMRFLSKDNGDTSLDISYNMLCGLVGDCHIIHSLFKLAGNSNSRIIEGVYVIRCQIQHELSCIIQIF